MWWTFRLASIGRSAFTSCGSMIEAEGKPVKEKSQLGGHSASSVCSHAPLTTAGLSGFIPLMPLAIRFPSSTLVTFPCSSSPFWSRCESISPWTMTPWSHSWSSMSRAVARLSGFRCSIGWRNDSSSLASASGMRYLSWRTEWSGQNLSLWMCFSSPAVSQDRISARFCE